MDSVTLRAPDSRGTEVLLNLGYPLLGGSEPLSPRRPGPKSLSCSETLFSVNLRDVIAVSSLLAPQCWLQTPSKPAPRILRTEPPQQDLPPAT